MTLLPGRRQSFASIELATFQFHHNCIPLSNESYRISTKMPEIDGNDKKPVTRRNKVDADGILIQKRFLNRICYLNVARLLFFSTVGRSDPRRSEQEVYRCPFTISLRCTLKGYAPHKRGPLRVIEPMKAKLYNELVTIKQQLKHNKEIPRLFPIVSRFRYLQLHFRDCILPKPLHDTLPHHRKTG